MSLNEPRTELASCRLQVWEPAPEGWVVSNDPAGTPEHLERPCSVRRTPGFGGLFTLRRTLLTVYPTVNLVPSPVSVQPRGYHRAGKRKIFLSCLLGY